MANWVVALFLLGFARAYRVTTTNERGLTYIEGRFTNRGGGKWTTTLTLAPGETGWRPTDVPTQVAVASVPSGSIVPYEDYYNGAKSKEHEIINAQKDFAREHGAASSATTETSLAVLAVLCSYLLH